MAAAEAQLPYGLVLDGELVAWDIEAGRLSFEALQRRAAAKARGALALVARWPAYFVAFDLMQRDGQELLTRPYVERRALFWRTCSPSTS
ncbi:ATP-dependent DNA ligase [Streptomyces erythrochromogenes]|uniref:ATP-dependent DNA ligase n=1 Tax=Streptomyces erythrochromogenes TaxID=285574 RepID=UPI0036FE3964